MRTWVILLLLVTTARAGVNTGTFDYATSNATVLVPTATLPQQAVPLQQVQVIIGGGTGIVYYAGSGLLLSGSTFSVDPSGLNVFITNNDARIITLPNTTVGFAGQATFLNNFIITNNGSAFAGKVVHAIGGSNAYGIGTNIPPIGATNTTANGMVNTNGWSFGGGASSSWKAYRAILTQAGTAAPVPVVLENSLGGVPTWEYNASGDYDVTLTGAFPDSKTFVMVGVSSISDQSLYHQSVDDAPPNTLHFYNVNGDDWQNSYAVEIRVCNSPPCN